MRTPTGSKLYLAEACPPSFALPWADEPTTPFAERGTAVHKFLQRVNEVGRETALAEVPEEFQARCAGINVEALILGSVASEVAFAWDPKTDTARELGRNLDRAYETNWGEVATTADVVGVGPDYVLVDEWKSGLRWVEPAATNLQARFHGLSAARAYGKTRAVVRVTKIQPSGEPYTTESVLGAIELDVVADRARDILQRIGWAEATLKKGGVPRVKLGDWCRWCPALRFCPGQKAAVALVATAVPNAGSGMTDEAILAALRSSLTPALAADVWFKLSQVERVAKLAREVIKAMAWAEPIDLGDGLLLGPRPDDRESVADGGIAFGVLREKYGEEAARAAVSIETSKERIEDAARANRPAGVTIKAEKEAILGALRLAGAVRTTTGQTVRVYRDPNASKKGGAR